jgi:crotonobetainyl-CoA:carnitine CoA-transferase CaiB-like acyl-CoA transferase
VPKSPFIPLGRVAAVGILGWHSLGPFGGASNQFHEFAVAKVDSPTAQQALDKLLRAIGLAETECDGIVTIKGKDPILSSRHRFGEVMAASQAGLGIALAGIWKAKTGQGQDVEADVNLAVHQHHGIHFMRQNGIKLNFVDDPAAFSLTKEFYPTRDGRFVKVETFYPRLRDAVFKVLACAPTVRAIEAAIMQWDAEKLEHRIRGEGGSIAAVRTAEEWLAHPVGERLAAKPVVEVKKIGESEPVPFSPEGDLPLSGLRVLDCTHVIGGPITGRTLAEFGAEVLHLSRADYPDHMNWRIETDIGKRSAYCDFTHEEDKRGFFHLLQDADVFTNSYLNLEDKGISPYRLADARPGIIAHELRCFDFEGEWANFRGFDMMAVTTSGYVASEGAPDAPQMPIQIILADYLAAYAGAAGIAAALLRRSREGGSYQVRVSLTRMAMWTQELGLLDRSALNGKLPMLDITRQTQLPLKTLTSPFGDITYLPSQIAMSKIKQHFFRGPEPLGSSRLEWANSARRS